jgi:hypothetical protein
MVFSFEAPLTRLSTVVSQVVLTSGGSGIPSALGSMLAESLPFLRGIASSIQRTLGYDHPGILPTTMVAYAMTSFLLGAVFLLLAALRCGNLAGYFPRTVMTGVIGNLSRRSNNSTDNNRCCWCLAVSCRTRSHASTRVTSSQLQYSFRK